MHRFKLQSLQFPYPHFKALHFSSPPHSPHIHNLKAVSSMASRLQTRSVIRFHGPDTLKFLQGLLTNDVKSIGEKKSFLSAPNLPFAESSGLYAALLTPQGRFLYDLFLYRVPRPEEKLDESGSGPGEGADEVGLLADVDSDVVDEVVECFKRYRLRSKVEIENLAKDFCCWQRFGGGISGNVKSTEESEASSVGYGASVDGSGVSAAQGNSLDHLWYKDPRLDILGFRGVFPSDTIPPLVEADKETDEKNYLQWRLEQGVAEGSSEIPKGEAIPLEYNLVGLNAISFDKGCYVGQEFIARTHHRGTIRKRLLPMKFVDKNGEELEQEVAPGSEVINTSSGKKVGTVTTALGCRGMGVLRLEEAFKGPGSLSIKGQDEVKVETIRPEWWPAEWSSEYQQSSVAA